MSTTIRPEVSQRNRYWIEKHRYYELKHFCLQYPIWRKARASIDGLAKNGQAETMIFSDVISNPTERAVMARAFYNDRMNMIETCAEEADEVIGHYILKAVTEGTSFEAMNLKLGIPCCKDIYYELYRRFFWLLNKARK